MFVGFAPIDKPRYAVSVVVEHGGGGSSVAAPIARDILAEAQRRNSARPGILPDGNTVTAPETRQRVSTSATGKRRGQG